MNGNAHDNDFNGSEAYDNDSGGYNAAKCMRAVAEPVLVSRFGDEVFARYRKIITDRMSREKIKFYNVTVSMTRIG